ncbi:DUF3604 domain-containing protein [Parahaliea aestuarii]|uniref:DUF3604 domain-containing protein n=1 Tax=Parahaliea aestuarii TaxID=1852021 RepID=A0A5C8ZY92_9GAMM|nr:DUF3604 domain-containing protein [Parahaliea aestuarii]TXS93545.1 DUF3604 domain-containing protein [Parahaliea aestuarii]
MTARCPNTTCLNLALTAALLSATTQAQPGQENTQVYFGAVHVHTNYSFDAFTNGTLASPADAYRWARGEAIPGGGGGPDLKIAAPLDFYAVSDHAEWMGVFKLMEDPNSPMSRHPLASRITSDDPAVAMGAFGEILQSFSQGKRDASLDNPEINHNVWQDIVSTADAYYRPGEFTTFPAFEWTSNPQTRNLHRVVVFQDSKAIPATPLSSQDSSDPEHLWDWMDSQRQAGATLLAIPHNANASDGLMFSLQTFDGEDLTADYSARRQRNEPLYEITQIKGTSETHPELSPNDEFAGFELWDYLLSTEGARPEHRRGSYARQALLDGIELAGQGKGNPFAYGFIGDSDTHNAAASLEEYNYSGKFAVENSPRQRLHGHPGQSEAQTQAIREFSSGGLAAVWAEDNTREAIFGAMQRRETYGTTGPRIKLRFFGGWQFSADDASSADFAQIGYRKGQPMGSTLQGAPESAGAPTFMVWAARDPASGNLDRVQIIKGWVDREGRQQERIHNVAWSGDRQPDARGQLSPVGDTVDTNSGDYSNSIGSPQLAAFWQDPDFSPDERAFYYVRVLEIPTPRWSTRDAAALGEPVPDNLPTSIQERAFSSPIWYSP